MRKRNYLLIAAVLLVWVSCTKESTVTPPDPVTPVDTTLTVLPLNVQPSGGDPQKGWDYLRYGDFMGGGFPYALFVANGQNLDRANVLERTGDNAILPPSFNAYTTPEGVKLVTGTTCLGCHSSSINGQFISGLGNSTMDFTQDNSSLFQFLEFGIKATYGPTSTEWKLSEPYLRASKTIAPYMVTPFKGINPALAITEAIVAHRDPVTLAWKAPGAQSPVAPGAVSSDVPPLWLAKKKYALYYNGMGRGDFTKLLMQVAVTAVEDTSTARGINKNFKDVVAWLMNLKAPKYPGTIDPTLVAQGKSIYTKNCMSCHGRYGDDEFYPNLLVSVGKVGTDPAYASYFVDNSGSNNWFSKSWYALSNPKASIQPSRGYVAPPLDGIWATAPYLHNGSVPDLETLLNSAARPKAWKRDFTGQNYDLAKVGWVYTNEATAKDKDTYNTTLKGYSNVGHTFGDQLSATERKALIEYLKTL